MFKQLIINVADHETRVALVEDGTIAELFINRRDDTDISGNIYKGRVQRVLPGMQAAFIDVGLDRAAFLHVEDLLAEPGTEVEIEILGKTYRATVIPDSPFDPKNERLRDVNGAND